VAVGFGIYGGERMTEIADERRRMVEQLQTAMDENAGLHAQLVAQAREAGVLDERQRMAREIHDTIAQGLTGVITQIEAIHQSFDDRVEVQRRLNSAADLARQSLEEARRSVQAIRPAPLDESLLPGAIADIAARWSESSGIPVEVNTVGERRALRPELEVTLLRVAQEGLANTSKHSGATRAGVTLTFMADSVTLDVRDDGNGFDPGRSNKSQSFGLIAMQQRIEHVHGQLHIESAPGEGTAISVNVPAQARPVSNE
jgi:signal transduction histidine kinase